MSRAPIIVGWKAIASHITDTTGLPVSQDQAKTMGRRDEDPLPTFQVGRGRRRPRAVRKNQLDAWIKREYPELFE